MATDKDIIVAIELGSSSIRGIAGRKDVDGSLQILDVVERKSKNCIRKGVIYNLDKTIQALNGIFIQLREDLNVYINKAYVGIAGQSLCTIRNSASKQMATKVVISNDIIDSLRDSNYNINYPDKVILDVKSQEYRIGTNYVTEPVGILSNQIEGRFLNIVIRSSVKENIQKCFDAVGVQIIDMYIAPLALSDNILTDNEKRSGCALVDFGAETTTVSIYKNNILRYLSVIPLGGNNLTLDICSKQVEEEEAEELKIKYGTAFSDMSREVVRHIPLSFDPGTTIAEDVLQEITEARMEEIIANVWEQIQQSGYADKLLSGIVITGGAANIPNIEKAISHKTKSDKIKFAKSLQTMIKPGNYANVIQEMNSNTLISLLACGECDCTDVDPNEIERMRLEEEENRRRKQEEEEERKRQILEEQKRQEELAAQTEKASKQQNETSKKEDDEEEEEEDKNKGGFMKSLKSKVSKLTKMFTETEE